MGTKFEDLYQLIPVGLQLSFLLSPILYEKAALGKYQAIANLNPIYQLLELNRSAILEGKLDLLLLGITTILNVAMIMIVISTLEKKRHTIPFLV